MFLWTTTGVVAAPAFHDGAAAYASHKLLRVEDRQPKSNRDSV
jgi:hypothetical protein